MVVDVPAVVSIQETGVCVKTGMPTDQTVVLLGRAEPRWLAWVLILGGVLAWLVAGRRTSRRFCVAVPCHPQVAAARQRGRVVTVVIALLSVLLGVWELAVGHFPSLGLGGLVLAVIRSVVNGTWHGVGVYASDETDRVTLSRVHPTFAAAVARSAAARG